MMIIVYSPLTHTESGLRQFHTVSQHLHSNRHFASEQIKYQTGLVKTRQTIKFNLDSVTLVKPLWDRYKQNTIHLFVHRH